MDDHSLDDWRDLLSVIQRICVDSSFDGDYIFRGQSNRDWPLESSFDRKVGGDLKSREDSFKRAFSFFEERLSMGNYPDRGREELIGLAQHYSFPTRTLDWSLSPYVALFFACSGNLESGSGHRPALFVLNRKRLEAEISSNELEILNYSPRDNDRLRNQKGCFSILKGPADSLSEFLDSKNRGDILTRISIAKEVVVSALSHLSIMDISFDRLFPGVDGIARQAWLEFLMRRV